MRLVSAPHLEVASALVIPTLCFTTVSLASKLIPMTMVVAIARISNMGSQVDLVDLLLSMKDALVLDRAAAKL